MKIYWNGTSKNIVGSKIRQLRQSKGLSRAALASQLQLLGIEYCDLTPLRIEQGSWFVPEARSSCSPAKTLPYGEPVSNMIIQSMKKFWLGKIQFP